MRSNFPMPSFLTRACLPLLLASCLWPLASGCAINNSGGPTVRASNRFQTVVSFAQPPNANYYYAVAFDDTGNNSRGPVAIDGVTPIGNGVVGGTFRLLVLYHQNQFRVFYRPTPSDQTTEREIPSTNLFDTGLSPQFSPMGLNVTINLDAQLQLPDKSFIFIFPRAIGSQTSPPSIAAGSLNINVVATNVILTTDTQNGLRKPVDALGDHTISTPVQIQINSTGIYTTSVSDPVGDINSGVSNTYLDQNDPNYVKFSTIDITNVQIAITRTTQ